MAFRMTPISFWMFGFLRIPILSRSLRGKSGLESEVKEYVLKYEETRAFLDRLFTLLEFTLPLYEREGKSSLTLALGCTGNDIALLCWLKSCGKRLDGTIYSPFTLNIEISINS